MRLRRRTQERQAAAEAAAPLPVGTRRGLTTRTRDSIARRAFVRALSAPAVAPVVAVAVVAVFAAVALGVVLGLALAAQDET